MKKIFPILCLWLLSLTGQGQTFIYADSVITSAGDTSSNIGFYNVQTCSSQIWGKTFGGFFKDIAVLYYTINF